MFLREGEGACPAGLGGTAGSAAHLPSGHSGWAGNFRPAPTQTWACAGRERVSPHGARKGGAPYLGTPPKYSALPRLELLQEAHIVLKEESEVIHPIAEHGYTLYPHTEGETAILEGVDTAGLKHIRVYHTAPEDL